MDTEQGDTSDTQGVITRKKNNSLSLAVRISVIHDNEKVHNTRKLAKMYGCSRGQIQHILWMKEKHLEEWAGIGKKEAELGLIQAARTIILEGVVREWIQRSRNQGQTINDTLILNVAHEVAKLINIDTKTLQLTPYWLYQLKDKFKIVSLDPLRTDNESKKSLNVIDILFEMKSAKALEGKSHLSKHILEQLESCCESITHSKLSKAAQIIILEDVVREWIQRSRSQGHEIDDMQILNIAHVVSRLINIDEKNFEATYTWLQLLKQKFQIVSLDPVFTDDSSDDDESKQSLNVVDILIEMKNAKALEPSSDLSKHILEQLESCCESAAQAASSSEIVLRSSPSSSLGSQVNGNEPRVLQKLVLEESSCDLAAERACNVIEILDESDDDDVVLLNNDLTPRKSSNVQQTPTNEYIVLEEEYIISSGDEIEKEEYITMSSDDELEKAVLQDIPDNPQTNEAHSGDFEASSSSNDATEEQIENTTSDQDKFKPISSYKDAIKFLGPLEDFVLTTNNIRAKGIIKQLVTVFLERMSLDND